MWTNRESRLYTIPRGGIVQAMEHAADHHGADEHSGHGSHDGHHEHGGHIELFRRKFWISLLLTVPTVVYSAMVQDWLGYPATPVPLHRWVAPVVGTAVF